LPPENGSTRENPTSNTQSSKHAARVHTLNYSLAGPAPGGQRGATKRTKVISRPGQLTHTTAEASALQLSNMSCCRQPINFFRCVHITSLLGTKPTIFHQPSIKLRFTAAAGDEFIWVETIIVQADPVHYLTKLPFSHNCGGRCPI
jgi:hypothetical protein